MKIKSAGLGLFFLLITLISAVGCGGGGGGVVTGPIVETPVIPPDSAFELPAGFSSVAFPAQGPVANLTLANFAAGSTANLYLMNFSSTSQAISWTAGATFGASARPSVKRSIKPDKPISPEQLFHLRLRQASQPVPAFNNSGNSLVKSSVRPALAVDDTMAFQVYVDKDTVATIQAKCMKISVVDSPKKVFFFVDSLDSGMAGLGSLLNTLDANWGNIYTKNRQIFGIEPNGTLPSNVDATDFYILLSRRVYTAGYFNQADFGHVISGGYYSNSNMKKIFYLELPEEISNSAAEAVSLSATMAHEFQHMIHYWQRGQFIGNSLNQVWLEEAMSGYAEYANGYRIENGLNQSKALQSNEYFERISGISFNKWHDEEDSIYIVDAYYGKAYLFGVWLAQHYGANGDVRALLSQRVGDEAAVAAFTGKSIEEIFANFMMALSVNDASDDSKYGIKDLDLTANYSFGANLADVKLNGPSTESVVATAGGADTETIAPYSAAYVRITTGNGADLYISANLPTYSAIYQLRQELQD